MSIGFITSTVSSIINGITGRFKNKDPLEVASSALKAVANDDYKRSSIRARASNSIAYYPMVVTENLSFETTFTLAKFIERNVAEMIRIIVSNENIINLDKDQTKGEMIAQFQGQTIGIASNAEFDRDGNFKGFKDAESEPMADVFKRYTDRELRRSRSPKLSNISEDTEIGIVFKDTSGGVLAEDFRPLMEGLNMATVQEMSSVTARKIARSLNEAEGDAEEDTDKQEADTRRKKGYSSDDLGVSGKISIRNEKANDIAPTVLELSVIYKDKGTGFQETMITMAIKVTTHIVRTDVMLDEIGRSVQNRRFMFPAIQWLTGEISFFKGLIADFDKIKTRVVSGHKDRGVRYLNRLRLMSSQNRLKSATAGDRMLPTTTLVLTSDEVAYIRDNYSVDLNSTREAEKFFELYGLMNFIIVDESTGAMYIYDEVRSQFDVSSVPKESKENKQQGDVIKALVAAMGAK